MKKLFKTYIYMLSALALLLGACNLEREIDINLPNTPKQLVVECYLEHGQPYRLLLTETVSFLDEPGVPDVAGASVVITHNGQEITLKYDPILDEENQKIYNYTSDSSVLVDSTQGGTYFLRISDRGRFLTAETSFLPKIPIKEIEWEFEDEDKEQKDDSAKALLLIRHFENPNVENYYRLIVNKDSLTGNNELDFNYRGIIATNGELTIGTSYNYKDEDSLIVRLYHIDKKAYDYFNSVEDANDANGNPFAQPIPILSGVTGGIGVFLALSYDIQSVVVKKE